MQYIHTTTKDYPLTPGQIMQRHPGISFPVPFSPADGYAEVLGAAQPAHDPATHKAVEGAPVKQGSQWRQVWDVVALTAQEIESARRATVPASVTRRQARQALLLSGLLDNVQPAIDAISDPVQRGMAQIEWDDSQAFERGRPLLVQIGMALGLDDAGLDALFVQAAAL